MGMEISSRRLQEADSRMQAEREGADRPVDDRDKERFDRAMQESRERDGQGGQENGRGGSRQDALSPQALLDSLFGSRMQSMQTSAVQAAPAPGDVDALVNELVDRILVSEPGKGSPEVRITLGQGPLSGAELCLARAQDGQLFIRLACADPASFQTAVGAQDALRSALERSGENVRVEIVQSRADGGNEGDARQQSFTLAGPHVANVLSFEHPVAPLTVGTIDAFIEYFMARHIEARVDYVHDEPAVRALCKQGGVAFLLPPFEKSDLFKGIVMGGVLPRKTFSMGHAEEKRYYIECRKIKE